MFTINARWCVPHATNQVITKLGAQKKPSTNVTYASWKISTQSYKKVVQTLKCDLKELEQQYGEAKIDNDVFLPSHQAGGIKSLCRNEAAKSEPG